MFLCRQLEYLELIALRFQKLDGTGEGILQIPVVPRFQSAVEGEDGTVAHVAFYVVQYLFRAHSLTVVAGYEIPHDDTVMVAKGVILPEPHVAVWRAEQVRVDNFVYPSGVGQIIRIGVFKAADVVEGMVADAVSVFYHHPVFVRVFADIVAYHEEGSFNIVFLQ